MQAVLINTIVALFLYWRNVLINCKWRCETSKVDGSTKRRRRINKSKQFWSYLNHFVLFINWPASTIFIFFEISVRLFIHSQKLRIFPLLQSFNYVFCDHFRCKNEMWHTKSDKKLANTKLNLTRKSTAHLKLISFDRKLYYVAVDEKVVCSLLKMSLSQFPFYFFWIVFFSLNLFLFQLFQFHQNKK